MKIHLRQRKRSNGKISLFLEFYKSITTKEGKVKPTREYEYLDLYLIDKPKTPQDKQRNKEILKLAESIKAKRELEVKNGEYGFKVEFKQGANFIDYFKEMVEEKKSKGNLENWKSALNHLIDYAGENITFKEINVSFAEGFKKHLDTTQKKNGGELSRNSKASYYAKFRACLNQAVKDKLIYGNPAVETGNFKKEDPKREYLTLDEVRALVKTPCRYDILKRAFLFSCLTGLRWSDVNNLEWKDIQVMNGEYRIHFKQQKTKGLQYLDINPQAKELMGEQGDLANRNPNSRVFTGLKYSAYMNTELQRWVMSAGITKQITFHCARHTFAVLQLTLGTEIYTLSKMLGHQELKTTQIYAKIVDEKIKEGMNKIPDINL